MHHSPSPNKTSTHSPSLHESIEYSEKRASVTRTIKGGASQDGFFGQQNPFELRKLSSPKFELTTTQPEVNAGEFVLTNLRRTGESAIGKALERPTPALKLHFNSFKRVDAPLEALDEDLEGVIDFEDRLCAELSTVDGDLIEADSAKLTSLW